MRYLTGAFGVLAAAGFVIYSAVTTYHVAYGMTTEFKELAGWAASGIVFWECLGLLYVRQCWQNGSQLLAVAGLALVIAAAIYTVRLDLRFSVAGQSDLVASRKENTMKLDDTKTELHKARADRDVLRKVKKPTEAQLDEIERIEKRIDLLESKWDTTVVVSTPMPEAGWASRMLKGISSDEGWWTDALMVFGLLFWPLARMIAMPLAIVSMQRAPKKPVQAVVAPRATDVAQPLVMPALTRQERAWISLMKVAPPKPDDTPPPADAKPVAELPGSGGGSPASESKLLHGPWLPKEPEKPEPKLSAAEARRLETIEAVKAFADEVLSLDADGAQLARTPKGFVQSGGTPGKLLGKQFRLWAKGNRKWGHLATCSQNPLGKALSAVIESGRHSNSGQTVYAAVLKDEKKRAIG